MPAEGNNDSFFLHRQNRGAGMLRPGTKIGHRAALPPLRNRLGVDPMTTRQCSQALLTMLYRSTDRLCRCGAAVKNLSHSASFESGDKGAPSNPGIKHLAYVYSRDNDAEARQAKVLTKDEARRIAINIARLPELLGKAGN